MDDKNTSIMIITALKQVMKTFRQKIHAGFKDMSLTGPQGMLLGTLFHNGEMKISDLGEKLGLSNSTVSGIVDRLEKQELVQRIRSEKDRRVVYVSITAKYKENCDEHFKKVEKSLEDIINKATKEELSDILKGLNTLQEVMDRQKDETNE
jgi:MarR family transcriptional regulator, organic hydroperoxide resistance regulator